MSTVLTRCLDAPPLCEREILRYAGCREADAPMRALLRDMLDAVCKRLTYKVCYCVLPLEIRDDVCDLGSFSVSSTGLAKNLEGCRQVLLFGATVGVEIDRLIAKYGRLAPSRALMLQAIGAERIEALCDAFCAAYAKENSVLLHPRFSPGYGDLALETQRDIFRCLDCAKRIGLCLNGSLLMSPTKSVTAFAGIKERI